MTESTALTSRPVGYDLRVTLPNRFFDEPYVGVDDAGWDYPVGYEASTEGLVVEKNTSLWCQLPQLLQHTKTFRLTPSAVVAVGIDLASFESSGWPYAYDESVFPHEISSDWKFLGYDIANEYLESVFISIGMMLPHDYPGNSQASGLIESEDVARHLLGYVKSIPSPDGPFFIYATYLIAGA
jgi:hypothetical protein